MSEFFLPNILENKTREEAIVAVLKARGFLIDTINGRYYLSDNASIDDMHFLSKMMDSYQLGRVIDPQHYAVSSRRSLGNASVFCRSYSINTLFPETAEIIINASASIDHAISLFNYRNRISFPSVFITMSWNDYLIEKLPKKPDVSCLEPYISSYVKAISSCGVWTCFSCDGNHENGGRMVICSDYPSSVWHECIWSEIVQAYFDDLPFVEEGISFSKSNQGYVYQTMNQIANFLYEKRLVIRSYKEKAKNLIPQAYVREHSSEDIEKKYREICLELLNSSEAKKEIHMR